MTAPLDARTLFGLLAEHGVEYVVVGGFSAIAHGVVRATKDLDICPSPEPTNLRRLPELLRGSRRVRRASATSRRRRCP